MRRVSLVLWCVAALACDKSSVVAPAPVPTSPLSTETVPAVTIVASISIEGGGTAAFASTTIASGDPAGKSVSLALSVKTEVSDSVKSVVVGWGDEQTTDLGAVSQGVASHSFSTAGAFVLTVTVDTSAGRHSIFPISLTI